MPTPEVAPKYKWSTYDLSEEGAERYLYSSALYAEVDVETEGASSSSSKKKRRDPAADATWGQGIKDLKRQTSFELVCGKDKYSVVDLMKKHLEVSSLTPGNATPAEIAAEKAVLTEKLGATAAQMNVLSGLHQGIATPYAILASASMTQDGGNLLFPAQTERGSEQDFSFIVTKLEDGKLKIKMICELGYEVKDIKGNGLVFENVKVIGEMEGVIDASGHIVPGSWRNEIHIDAPEELQSTVQLRSELSKAEERYRGWGFIDPNAPNDLHLFAPGLSTQHRAELLKRSELVIDKLLAIDLPNACVEMNKTLELERMHVIAALPDKTVKVSNETVQDQKFSYKSFLEAFGKAYYEQLLKRENEYIGIEIFGTGKGYSKTQKIAAINKLFDAMITHNAPQADKSLSPFGQLDVKTKAILMDGRCGKFLRGNPDLIFASAEDVKVNLKKVRDKKAPLNSSVTIQSFYKDIAAELTKYVEQLEKRKEQYRHSPSFGGYSKAEKMEAINTLCKVLADPMPGVAAFKDPRLEGRTKDILKNGTLWSNHLKQYEFLLKDILVRQAAPTSAPKPPTSSY